ncbi:MAG: response regulator [Deltaproteobacteria bacterium]|nr:response regulator [Deltaproteobacteria bacterium]
METSKPQRILIVDDNPEIHTDFKKLLEQRETASELDSMDAELFGSEAPVDVPAQMSELSSAYQGVEAVELVRAARSQGDPFSVAFVDVRMPPGIDGVATTRLILAADPEVQVVICSAYSDYTWTEMIATLGATDRMIVLRKPFEPIEVRQLALALCQKWVLGRRAALRTEELEALIKQRTAALERAVEELREEMARRERMEATVRGAQKLEAVGRLAGGVAHHLNTPIQYITSDVEFLETAFAGFQALVSAVRQGAATPEQLARAQKLTQLVPDALSSTRSGLAEVTKIVMSLSEFARPPESGFAPVDLNRALRNMVDLARGEYEGVATIELELGPVPEVYCRHGELNQVFFSLLINAVHAIEDGGVEEGKIRIETRRAGDHVEVVFSDNGCGIPDDDQPRVFTPFFTTKEVDRGRGLSLSIARSVIEMHEGAISFESVEGDGSRFTVRLAVHPEAD